MVLKLRNEESKVIRRNLATYLFPESIISEQYRSIRTNIQFLNGIKKSQSILITSPNKSEGKSTTAVNLAISLAQQQERVLLVDANIKKPSLHSTFNQSNSYGLTDILSKKLSHNSAIQETEIRGLDFLPSGPSSINSVELLGSETMFHLMRELLLKYETVIFDGPPVLEQSETKILANFCNGVVLVIKSEKTSSEKAVEAKRFLELAKAKIIGVILNEKK